MTKHARLNFNQQAPDVTLLDVSERPVRLSDLWRERPLLLSFTRHFGCTECKQMLDELVSGRERIEASGLSIAVVTQGKPAETARFIARYGPGLTALSDPERKSYQAYGLERGGPFQLIVNWKVWKAVAKARKKGYAVEFPPPGQDVRQMSGVFIISRSGRVELPYYYDDIADHPPLDLLLSGVLSTRWDRTFDGPIGPSARS